MAKRAKPTIHPDMLEPSCDICQDGGRIAELERRLAQETAAVKRLVAAAASSERSREEEVSSLIEQRDALERRLADARGLSARLMDALRPFVMYFEHARQVSRGASSYNFPDPIADGLVVTEAEIDEASAAIRVLAEKEEESDG